MVSPAAVVLLLKLLVPLELGFVSEPFSAGAGRPVVFRLEEPWDMGAASVLRALVEGAVWSLSDEERTRLVNGLNG